jgi:predicted amidohydrolase YtcJ
VSFSAGAVPAFAQDADTILVNGKVVTVDAQSSTRERVAVRDGVIIAVGRTTDIRKLAGPKTRTIDLQVER